MANELAAEGIEVVVEDGDDSVRTDPVTGNIEIDQPDGGVVIQFGGGMRPQGADGKFYDNLASDLDQSQRALIAENLLDAIAVDDRSRSQWLTDRQKGLDLLGLQLKEPKSDASGDASADLGGLSTVTNPLLLQACLKAWATAQAEMLPAAGPCKVQDLSIDETAQQSQKAEALERGMNGYLTDRAKEYYPDTSRMLLWGPIFSGSGFKKVYYHPLRRRPVSERVDPQDIIVSDTSSDLRSAERVTHTIMMRRSVLRRMQAVGHYLSDVEISSQPTPDVNVVDEKIAAIQGVSAIPERPEDQPYTIYECQCELDLDQFAPPEMRGHGIALPYRVTLEKDSRAILAIRRDWVEDDEMCERRRLYVQYSYIPGPGFYGTGLLHILGNSSAAMTAAWREALDAGMLASFPGFLISKAATRQNTSDVKIAAGTATPIETNGRPIGEVVAQLPYRDPTPGLMSMIDRIVAQSKEAASSVEIPVGEGTSNIPVGTMMAMIEQATQVMAATHKGFHTAQSEELEMLADLFREYPESFWLGNKKAKRDSWDDEKFLAALEDCTLAPKSDPNIPSHVHRIMKVVAMIQIMGVPEFKGLLPPKEVLSMALSTLRIDIQPQDPPPPPTGPSPEAVSAQAKLMTAENQAKKIPIDAAKEQNRSDEIALKAHTDSANKTVDMAQEIVKQDAENRRADQKHGLDVAQHGLAVKDHLLQSADHHVKRQKAETDAAIGLMGVLGQQTKQPPSS